MLILGFILLLSIGNVLAIGITPGRTTLNFQPGMHQEITFSVVNSENKDMSVVFTVRGDLAEYVTLNQAYAEFSSGEESKSFTYIVDLPQKLDTPGTHEAEIVALEMPKDLKEKGTFIGATVSVITQLHVDVPYPNKYAEAAVNIMEGEEGKIVFLVPIVNKGKIDIVNAKAMIDIYTSLNEKVATVDSNSDSIGSLKRKELSTEWDSSSFSPGRYLAKVVVVYDDEIINIEKEFNVGGNALEIKEVVVKDFQLGGIAKFESLVENKWSSALKDVFLNILVYNNEDEVMADFKSPTYDMPSMETVEMIAYWDTAGVKAGTYDSKVLLKYQDKSIDRNVQMKITEDSIEVIGLTGHVVVSKKGAFNVNNLLIILVVFLIVVNIVWFVIVKRVMKKRKS
ncbi:MAG: hypothetical protein ABIB79_03265 [archaeon]